ncbi:hypothetical protein XJ44_08955 [Thermosipho affectus]|uniref:CRISPR-associated endoribonuclease Cas2 n=1 Tax=Thermosipho affectus TaxID=660294 RepID=A0ABX3IGL0_9BACT|nr:MULTISPECIES: CRISPR-associated endonuclease Cas2 [Thermosipho]ANQ54516.1 CRISPR-associated protein Cas2 [Thermosipho sp. 1070]APT72958.1 CRISPR-associated protein Cas2 [Thermosipho sp. 1063]ONN26438.1 hypothetical protein XJ44_08955 [Thermosipho affectus]OOC42412.1 hypothetical protein XO08_09100 [Thermosipho sp. 1074]
MMYVISYDITNDKRRRKLTKYLESYGVRVQYSVFETELSREQLSILIRELKKRIDEKEDTIRIYPISKDARKSITTLGKDKGSYYKDDFLII